MINCKTYETPALQKTYGGMGCQPHPHTELPFTGFNAVDMFCFGLILLMVGFVFTIPGRDKGV